MGVTVAKTFGEDKFMGTVDKFRGQRGRYLYHVTYTDGGEEELSQKELRDCYLLALAPQIEREWATYKKLHKGTCSGNTSDSSGHADSDGEGSLYDKHSDEEELNRRKKKRRKEKRTKSLEKNKDELSRMVLPTSGKKTVAAEAFGKLDSEQHAIVKGKINQRPRK